MIKTVCFLLLFSSVSFAALDATIIQDQIDQLNASKKLYDDSAARRLAQLQAQLAQAQASPSPSPSP